MDVSQHSDTVAPRLGRYEIDTDRSRITFRTRHLFGLLPVRGSFGVGQGIVDIAGPLGDSRVRAEVPTASFRTGNDRRDEHVRSPAFLDAARHPVMTFVSTQVTGTSLTGTLSVGEVCQPVDLSVELVDQCAAEFTVRATTRIDRTAFGITASPGLAGRHLDVSLEITCVHQ